MKAGHERMRSLLTCAQRGGRLFSARRRATVRSQRPKAWAAAEQTADKRRGAGEGGLALLLPMPA